MIMGVVNKNSQNEGDRVSPQFLHGFGIAYPKKECRKTPKGRAEQVEQLRIFITFLPNFPHIPSPISSGWMMDDRILRALF